MVIRQVGRALPRKIISNAELSAFCPVDETFMEQKVGIFSRHWLSQDEDGLDLAAKACQSLFEKSGLQPHEVDVCVWVGQAHDALIPHASALLQASLGLGQSCMCFDLGLACSGYVHALALGQALISSGQAKNCLLVTCDPYSRILDKGDRNTAPLFGDAATATWLGIHGDGIKLGMGDFGTDGTRARYLACGADTSARLHMDGKGIFNFAIREVPLSINRCLEKNGQTKKDIDYFVLHQANRFILEYLFKIMGIPTHKYMIDMSDVANTVSSSIPLILADLMNKLLAGDKLVLSAFGAGLSWGTIYGQYLTAQN